jgi:hypothetical protein
MKPLAAVPIWLSIGLSAAYAAGPPSAEEMLPGCKIFLSAAEGLADNAALNRNPGPPCDNWPLLGNDRGHHLCGVFPRHLRAFKTCFA